MLPTGQVLYFPHPILSMTAKPVEGHISTNALKRITDAMFETMHALHGVGLAAPQVGVLDRIVVMDCGKEGNGPQVLINPSWQTLPEIPASDGTGDALDRMLGTRDATPGSQVVEVTEGCLSFPGIFEKEKRYDKILVHFLDLDSWGHLASSAQVFEGLEAQCIQHETEHLDGVTLASRMGPVKKSQAQRKVVKLTRAIRNMRAGIR